MRGVEGEEMITLRDLFKTTWDITELDIFAREPETMAFVHHWIYGEDIKETTHMYYDRIDGRLSIINGKINDHGELKHGSSEIGWGVKEKLFPDEIIDAPVTHLRMQPMSGPNGVYCSVDIEMHSLTAQKYIKRLDEG